MNEELLTVLDHLEREKGIKKEIIIAAIEAALVSAARKTLKLQSGEVLAPEDLTVKLNAEDGSIKIFLKGEEVRSPEFGRIAAQTAKQIIIQKLREAEREVIYDDFHAKEGSLITGIIHRIEKGSVIVDLGKTEGILPRKEQIFREEYRQGGRLRAYCVEVKKTPRGPEILLSRTRPEFVKKLFELEVPEIGEGIVEIRAIVREPGYRTKIAVSSKDEKVDSVGACVGMRGNRVKDIVRELGGERIDVIHWSDDIREYAKAAMGPAEVLSMELDKENKKILLTIPDDQLSIAIGKQGQNVRLASKLVGWEIDVCGKEEKAKEALEEKPEKKEAAAPLEATSPILMLKGVGPKIQRSLIDAGFDTMEKVAAADIRALTAVKGIGPKTAEKILAAAKGEKPKE